MKEKGDTLYNVTDEQKTTWVVQYAAHGYSTMGYVLASIQLTMALTDFAIHLP